jgi:hypothetical protein
MTEGRSARRRVIAPSSQGRTTSGTTAQPLGTGAQPDSPHMVGLLAARDRAHEALAVDDAQRLLAVRRLGLQQVDRELAAADDRTVLGELSAAGAELVTSLSSLHDDAALWAHLRSAEVAVDGLPRTTLLRMREVLDQDLVSVLPAWGYRPPPSDLEFARGIQEAVAGLVGTGRPEPGTAHRVDRAREELGWFLLRLRRVLAEGADSTTSRTHGPQERAVARVRVSAWVRRAALAVAPAAVAAGAVGAVSGPAAGLAAGAAAAGSEAVKRMVEVGATDLMGRLLGTAGMPEPDDLALDLEVQVDDAVDRVAPLVDRPEDDADRQAAVFLLRRALYRVLLVEPGAEGLGPLRDWCEDVLGLLREAPLEDVVDHWANEPAGGRPGKTATGPPVDDAGER